MTPRPDLSKIKKKIANEVEEPLEPKSEEKAPQMSPETLEQVKRYAQDVETMRHQEAEEAKLNEQTRVELEELPESVKAARYEEETVFYRNTPYDNPEIRAEIEGMCELMDFSDLVLTGRVHQEVPILKDILVVRYRSLLASESYWIGRQAEDEATTDWAIRSWIGYARMAISVESINGRVLDPYEDDEGKIDNEAFHKRFNSLMNEAEKVVDLLLVHLTWFTDRTDRLYTENFEQLKNG